MPRPSSAPHATDPERPPIWVDGSQAPKFDIRAWAVVGHGMARRWLVPHLGTASTALTVAGFRIAGAGYRINLGWMGRAERAVPSRQAVGAAVAALALRLAEAREILAPSPPPPQPLAYPNLIRTPDIQLTVGNTSPAPPAADLPQAKPEPTLDAIRAVLRSLPQDDTPLIQPARQSISLAGAIQPKAPAQSKAKPGALRPILALACAHAIAWSSLTLSLPVGLVQALMFHLNGGDLADWD